jgi:hypothetical protein
MPKAQKGSTQYKIWRAHLLNFFRLPLSFQQPAKSGESHESDVLERRQCHLNKQGDRGSRHPTALIIGSNRSRHKTKDAPFAITDKAAGRGKEEHKTDRQQEKASTHTRTRTLTKKKKRQMETCKKIEQKQRSRFLQEYKRKASYTTEDGHVGQNM